MKFTYDHRKELEVFSWIKNKISEPSRSMTEEELVKVVIPEDALFLKDLISKTSNDWEKVENNFLTKLGTFYGKRLVKPDLTVYLVRFRVFPYNFEDDKKWFCAPLFESPPERIRVIMHELCHYLLPHPVEDSLKEAIPVILNDHETFQMFSYDRGGDNPKEHEWRKKVWEAYKAGGTFEDVLKQFGAESH